MNDETFFHICIILRVVFLYIQISDAKSMSRNCCANSYVIHSLKLKNGQMSDSLFTSLSYKVPIKIYQFRLDSRRFSSTESIQLFVFKVVCCSLFLCRTRDAFFRSSRIECIDLLFLLRRHPVHIKRIYQMAKVSCFCNS